MPNSLNFFSGIESENHFSAAMRGGARHMLTSYLYLRKKGTDMVKTRKSQYPDLHFFIDSGAHSFQMGVGDSQYAKWSLSDFETYVKEYADWIRANRDYIFCAAELDIESRVGLAKVKEWQEKYFYPLEQEGIPICYVWHSERGFDGWEEMCQKHSYVGLPGELSKEKDFNKYMAVAKRYTCKVHGFAATKQTDFRDWPWFSVDSITWKSAEMYGVFLHWDWRKQKLVSIDKINIHKRAWYKDEIVKAGYDSDAIIHDTDYKEVTNYAIYAFHQMEQFYQKLYSDRVFYYELRLPHPDAFKKLKAKNLVSYWNKMRPKDVFTLHSSEDNVMLIKKFLHSLACVQYQKLSKIRKSGREFLEKYFQLQLDKNDPIEFQKELSLKIAPLNPVAIPRTSIEDFIPENSPPRVREDDEFLLGIEEDEDYLEIFELEDLLETYELPYRV